MPTGGQKRGKGGADQARCPGDGDDQRVCAGPFGVAVRSQVVGELSVAIGEGGVQRRPGHGGVDPITHPGGTLPGLAELVGMTPPADDARRPGGRSAGGEHVDEAVRRIETGRFVPGHPPQPPGQPQHGPPVGQRLGLRQHLHRLPGRDKPGHGTGPGVPSEHLGKAMIDDALELDAHGRFLEVGRLRDSESLALWIAHEFGGLTIAGTVGSE